MMYIAFSSLVYDQLLEDSGSHQNFQFLFFFFFKCNTYGLDCLISSQTLFICTVTLFIMSIIQSQFLIYSCAWVHSWLY